MQEIKDLWEKVLNKMEMHVTAISYELWIKTLEVLDYNVEENKLVLLASSPTSKNQLITKNLNLLVSSIQDVFESDVQVEILDPQEKENYIKENEVKEIVQSKKEEKNPFNSKYTFENFVVGKSNQIVYAASKAVAENPGHKFNPLFIYGGVGLGKTHLLHAIGNFLREHNPDLKIMYNTCEKFTNDYIESISNFKENSTSSFRNKYRNIDVLMIDDIQFISNKTGTQEEFFHTFNDLYQNNKQIIISSDRPPKEIETLEERLRSRFTCGLIQDIQAPDFETRVAILRKKAAIEKYYISDDAIQFIAEKVDTNIREMEGLLSKVYFFATLLGKTTATLDEAQEALKEYIDNNKQRLTPEKIIECVTKYFNITKEDITGKKKNKEFVEPRMIAIYLITDILDLPLVSIGKLFNNRDHTTIIHARDKIYDSLKSNSKLKVIVNDIRYLLQNM